MYILKNKDWMVDKSIVDANHHEEAARFRSIQNWIGKPGSTVTTASYIPPPPGKVEPCLAVWEKFLHESTDCFQGTTGKPDE